MKIKITNIKWDTDGQKVKLPKEEIYEIDNDYLTDILEDDMNDYLSDKYGYCMDSYNCEILNDVVVVNEDVANIKNLIEDVMCANFCEDDPKTYLHYIEKDIDAVCDFKENSKYMEDECIYNHILEELYLLQDIIHTIYKGGN